MIPAELHRIYTERIAPLVFAGAVPAETPVLVLVGGQPGAGKSVAIGRLADRYPERDIVSIVGDDFRRFHPDYPRVLAADPVAMPRITAEAAGAWTRMAVSEGVRRSVNMLVEGTWRDSAVPLATARQASLAGYFVHAGVIAVPRIMSLVATLTRFYDALEAGVVARWTPFDVHESAVAGLPATVRALAGASAVDRFTVCDRTGVAYLDGGDDAGGFSARADAAAAWFELLTERDLSEVERVHLRHDARRAMSGHARYAPTSAAAQEACDAVQLMLAAWLG